MSAPESGAGAPAPAQDDLAGIETGADRMQNTLLFQQAEAAQRIAKQLLNQPMSQPTQFMPQQFLVPQYADPAGAARGAGAQPPPPRMLPTYATTPFFPNQLEAVAMPPLQGALQQELPSSLPMMAHAGGAPAAAHPADEYLMSIGVPAVVAPSDAAAQKAAQKRSSRFRGVTKHRRSGRWEAHIWVKASGKQVYLGGYELEEHAAEAYDVAAIKCKGPKVKTNFPLEKYRELMRFMDTISLEELVMAVRRQSQGFARGSSGFRGVTHHPNGRWEARIGMPGSKHIYLGLFNEEQMAAQAYDRALVKLRGPAAATNFALSEYKPELQEFYKRKEDEKDGGEVDVAALLKTDSRRRQQSPTAAGADDAAAPAPAAAPALAAPERKPEPAPAPEPSKASDEVTQPARRPVA